MEETRQHSAVMAMALARPAPDGAGLVDRLDLSMLGPRDLARTAARQVADLEPLGAVREVGGGTNFVRIELRRHAG